MMRQAHMCVACQYCEALARRLGLGEQVVEGIKACRPLHDVGQINFPIETIKNSPPDTGGGNAHIID